MKKILLKLLIIFVIFSAQAKPELAKPSETPKFPKGKGAILLDDLKEGTVYGSLEKMPGKHKAKSTRLIGQLALDAPKDKLLAGNKFVLIGWLGVQKTQEPSKVVMFKEPIVSSFIVQAEKDAKGIILPTFGEEAHLLDALERLEAGEVDEQDIKKKRKIKIPTGSQELLLPQKSARTTSGSVVAENASSGTLGEAESSRLKSLTEEDKASSLAASEKSKKSESSDYKARRDYTHQNQNSTEGILPTFNHNTTSPASRTLAAIQEPSPDRLASSIKSSPINKGNPFSLHVLSSLDEKLLPNVTGNAVVLVKKPSGSYQAYLVRDGVFVRGKEGGLLSKEATVDLSNFELGSNGMIKRTAENSQAIDKVIDEILFSLGAEKDLKDQPKITEPIITIESTDEGCLPEHNELQETVTILRRLKTFKDGIFFEQTPCEKTLEIYGVKRDYLCEQCDDEIQLEEGKVYPKYQEFWFNANGERRNLNIKIDLKNPLDLMEDSKACDYDTTTEPGFALEKSQLGYFNKFGVFKIVEACRVLEGAPKYPIQETSKGCSYMHDFANKLSYEQRRTLFRVKGVEHEVETCQQKEPGLPHEFIRVGCKPLVDTSTGILTYTAKRQIRTASGVKMITAECEPIETQHLLVTRQGCEGQYVHDFVSGKSYLKKRYYFLKSHELEHFVTGCIRTDDYLSQQTEHPGEWIHDDVLLVSKPKLSLYITCPEKGKMTIDEPKVRGTLGQKSYTFIQDKLKPTTNFYFEGCFRRTRTELFKVYQRADNSLYEKPIGPGAPILSTIDECKRKTEKEFLRKTDTRTQVSYANTPMNALIHHNIFRQRITTTYPNGTVTSSAWQEISEQAGMTYIGSPEK